MNIRKWLKKIRLIDKHLNTIKLYNRIRERHSENEEYQLFLIDMAVYESRALKRLKRL
jgi:hypothetical protein